MRGLFVTVEGIDGSGKTTVVNELAKRLKKDGIKVCVTKEPGDTLLGATIRQILLQSNSRTALAEVFLFLADRAEHVNCVIKPALEKGEIVLCDRFTDSTVAYQSFGLGLPLLTILELKL